MWRVCTPTQSSNSVAGCGPHTAAVGDAVVGRRAPISATGLPTSALKIDDFPLPVAPANAATVWLPAIDVRAATFATSRPASATASGSS